MTIARNLKYSDALDEALVQAMLVDPDIFVMGCGVDDEGGIFGTTVGAFKKFGPERVMDVPLAENAINGIGMGAALLGKRPVIVHARNDFLYLALDQIANHAAKWNIMSGGKLNCPLVIRAIVGRGWGQAAQHSQSLQALFSHIPGLKVVMPSNAYDAKGLLMASLKDSEPVIIIEHRFLYDTRCDVPETPYFVPMGQGKICRNGKDVTAVAFSYMVKEVLEAAQILAREGVDLEVIDPRCSVPLDMDLITRSVKKTGRLVVVDTSWKAFGISAEIVAQITEKMGLSLKGLPVRIGLPSQSTPCSSNLEKDYYPGVEGIIRAIRNISEPKRVLGLEVETVNTDHLQFKGPF